MVKVIGPAISLGAAGSLGQALTFQKKGGGHSVYLKSKPGARAPYIVTPEHQSQENRIGYIVAWWQALTDAQKAQWDVDAKASGIAGTGYHYFMKTHGGKSSPWPNGFLHRKKITIDHTKVSGDQVNFPMLFSVIDADLASCQSTGNDLLFTASDGRTKLDHEIERFVVASGTLIAWVRIPSLSSTVDTELYIYYQQPAVPVTQANPTGVWNSNYRMVTHMKDDPDTSHVADSTINNRDGTKISANQPIEADGKIGKGQDYDGINDQITFGTNISSFKFGTGDFTIQGIVQGTKGLVAGLRAAVFGVTVSGAGGRYAMQIYKISGLLEFIIIPGGGGGVAFNRGDVLDGNYHKVDMVVSRSTNLGYLLIDGVQSGAAVSIASFIGDISPQGTGVSGAQVFGDPATFDGIFDEIRLVSGVISAGQSLTEYNNEFSLSTFFSVGAEE